MWIEIALRQMANGFLCAVQVRMHSFHMGHQYSAATFSVFENKTCFARDELPCFA